MATRQRKRFAQLPVPLPDPGGALRPDTPDSSSEPSKTFQTTAYGPPWGGINGPGIATACGVKLNGGKPTIKAVAAGPEIPCGSVLRLEDGIYGKGDYVVWDRGGAIGEGRLDFYHSRRAAQLSWGTKTVKGFVIPNAKIDLSGKTPEQVADELAKIDPDEGNAFGRALDSFNPIEGIADAVAAVAQVVEGIAKFFIGLGELLLTPEGWARLGKLLFGVALLWVGVNRLLEASIGFAPRTITNRAYVGAARRIGERGAIFGGIR